MTPPPPPRSCVEAGLATTSRSPRTRGSPCPARADHPRAARLPPLAEMRLEEGRRASRSGRGVGGMVVVAVWADEGVVPAGVAVDRHIRPPVERQMNARLGLFVDVLVFFRQVQHQGALGLVSLVEMLVDAAPIVGDGGVR